jgi:hypothetical protein
MVDPYIICMVDPYMICSSDRQIQDVYILAKVNHIFPAHIGTSLGTSLRIEK